MCEYCRESKDNKGWITGSYVARTSDWKNTAGYNPKRNESCFNKYARPEAFEFLEAFILKGKADEKAGLIINTISGGRYIDINYCPMCGRKLS